MSDRWGRVMICALPLHDQHRLPRSRAAEHDRQHSKRRREGTLNRDIYILGAVNNTIFLMVCVVPLALLYPIYMYIYIYIYISGGHRFIFLI